MKKIMWDMTNVLVVMLLMVGCANWGGNNPVGVTGGSDQGYGMANDIKLPTPSSGSSSDLIGTWRYDHNNNDYETITFNSNGKFSIAYYENNNLDFSYSGNYTTSGSSITLYIEGNPNTGTFLISDNVLTLNIFNDSQTYYRIS